MGETDLLNRAANASFLSRSQFRIGGLGKGPDEHADPYHTYLGLAALAMYPPEIDDLVSSADDGHDSEEQEHAKERRQQIVESWQLAKLDPLINANEETTWWARKHVSGKSPTFA